jgi:hypothetical protein
MPAGNRTKLAEDGWHVCDNFQQEESIEYLLETCARSQISALRRGNMSQPNRDWRLTRVVLGVRRDSLAYPLPVEQTSMMCMKLKHTLTAIRDI